MKDNRYPGLDTWLAARGDVLLGAATLLAGSRPGGEDLMQAGLERLMRNWKRVNGDPEGYLRRTIYHLAVDGWRQRRRRPETALGHLAELSAAADETRLVDIRADLITSLATLPPRQRAVVVLRFFEELSEAETASALRCSLGTVKSTTSKALARLRADSTVTTAGVSS